MIKPLSPAAQAVLDGFRAVPTLMDGPSIAGALRAAADQLTPYTVSEMEGAAFARNRLLAIAAELEGVTSR